MSTKLKAAVITFGCIFQAIVPSVIAVTTMGTSPAMADVSMSTGDGDSDNYNWWVNNNNNDGNTAADQTQPTPTDNCETQADAVRC